MAALETEEGSLSVLEDFSDIRGEIAVVDPAGSRRLFAKSAERTSVDGATLYRGHTLREVHASAHDLLGRELLALPDDPTYAEVAACFAPISEMVTYAFVGTPDTAAKVGIEYGGRTPDFNPASFAPHIAEVRAARGVLDGIVGGWLPVLRFVYPDVGDAWTELVVFAAQRLDSGNDRIQPVWYRVCRVEGGELAWVRYVDTFPPSPPRMECPDPERFYLDLLAVADTAEAWMRDGMQVELPGTPLADQARHSLLRAAATRIGGFPKYGVMDRLYGGSEHDGFQDTFTADVTAALGWGLLDHARRCIDNYLRFFVRGDGSILYRGPETGQFGRMLTVIAQYLRYTGDDGLLLEHRARIEAIAQLLVALREAALRLPAEDPAHGVIAGWCEADSALEEDPERYRLPYLSNNAEAARGLGDLGTELIAIGTRLGDASLSARGVELRVHAAGLREALQVAIARSSIATEPTSIPIIAGALEPFDAAVMRDPHDPQFRAYRAHMELLFSGVLTEAQVAAIVRYREARHDVLLGVPAAYGYNHDGTGEYAHGELAGFLSYGHAYGLLQYDMVREFLLELYSLSAHQYTRGTWTAPETRRIDPTLAAAPYAVPAQLAVPMLLRWALVFEQPDSSVLWLCKAVPRDWLADGREVAVSDAPVDGTKVGFRVRSRLASGEVDVTLDLGAGGRETRLRLRVPGARSIDRVDGPPGAIAEDDTLVLPAAAAGELRLTVHYA